MFPLARVETMTFGKPMGSSRMQEVARAVPPPPPSEMMASILPCFCSCVIKIGAAFAMATTQAPLSWASISGCRSSPAVEATSKRVMSGLI